ncbi:hypothetical protein B0H63DRAFT_500300 [Podospora didyma]|uniref:Uncharacterized protein n=1 Tax=Podospora didyma TaxID=330526 RepID=A0AAE0U5E8_9PEZI|nr:hypothetical protein B0H63DRAFT_500300 [Podospora didyma]
MAPDTLSLAGRVAIVTGSGQEGGLGAGIALALTRNGAKVTLNYVSDSTEASAYVVADKIQAFGTQALGAAKLVKETLAGFETDTIDILVNNAGAGIGMGTMISDLTPDQVQKAFAINNFGTLYAVQAATAHMPRGDRIVNIGTAATRMTNVRGAALYGASKAAQEHLTTIVSAKLGPTKGIAVNTIVPGPTMTAARESDWFPAGKLRDEILKKFAIQGKLDRFLADVANVADAVLLVVSDHARWITGQFISPSGGMQKDDANENEGK